VINAIGFSYTQQEIPDAVSADRNGVERDRFRRRAMHDAGNHFQTRSTSGIISMNQSSTDWRYKFRRFGNARPPPGKKYMNRIFLLLLLGILGTNSGAFAESVLKTVQVADDVYALIGPTTNRDQSNLGNNANFGVIVTEEGIVLVDPGGTYKGAQMIHDALRAITDRPIKFVINTGGQDHRWLGNGYFKAGGAHIIAHEKAVIDQKDRAQDQMILLGNLVGSDGLKGTEPTYADETFEERKSLTVGGTKIEIVHAGHAHTPGDSFVWLPDHGIVFSGDIVYVDRMLGIGPQSAHLSWIQAFDAMAEKQPNVVVPGHGMPTDLDKAKADTSDYLVFLREAVRSFMDEGYGMEEISRIDQSRFSYLKNYDLLKGRNAQRVYEELEWE
jgi:glyoxylase-like metal-dependent hydrolase (beta-lactamase superfamily II)